MLFPQEEEAEASGGRSIEVRKRIKKEDIEKVWPQKIKITKNKYL